MSLIKFKPYSKKCRKCGETYTYSLREIKASNFGSHTYCSKCHGKNSHP